MSEKAGGGGGGGRPEHEARFQISVKAGSHDYSWPDQT